MSVTQPLPQAELPEQKSHFRQRLEAMSRGFRNGAIKYGLPIGLVSGVGLTGGAAMIAMNTAQTLSAGIIGIPVVGPAVATIGGLFGASKVYEMGAGQAMLETVKTVGAATLPTAGILIGGGAVLGTVIGGLYGAVSGFFGADKEIKLAEEQRARELNRIRMANIEQQKLLQQQLLENERQRQMLMQAAHNAPYMGQEAGQALTPGLTPGMHMQQQGRNMGPGGSSNA